MVTMSNVVCVFALIASAHLVAAADPKGPTNAEYKAAQAKKADEAAAEAANESKMAGVNKVIEMLDNLQAQVLEEGDKEAATYDKFACFCKDMTNEKTDAIKKGKDAKTELSATIKKLSKDRNNLDTKIGTLNKDIKKAENAMAKLKRESDDALAVYEKNEADLSGAIFGVTEAVKVLSSSKGGSFLQLQSMSKDVQSALMLADALGLTSSQSAAQIFLQDAPQVEMENYKFHSSTIVKTLEKLQAEFEAKRNEVDAAEVKRVAEFDMAKQKNTDLQKAKNLELDQSTDSRDQKSADIAENSEELTTVSATLFDDQQYLSKLSDGCSAKAKTWDQRSKVRVQELTAITEATDIVKHTVAEKTGSATIRFAQTGSVLRTADAVASDEQSMEALEAAAEGADTSAPLAFLQRRQIAKTHDVDVVKQMVVSLLHNSGKKLKSTLLLSLATQITGDPFAKIKKLIQELIERLLTEAANEANQKGWCDKAIADATQKRDMASEKSAELNSQMAQLEATRDKLTEELSVLATEIKELTEAQAKAQKLRTEEKAENKETVIEAKVGLEATNKAIQILSRFYGTAAKAKIDLSLSQEDPFANAPDAGFKNGEAYTAAGSDSGGITGMLEVIASDFQRTISETESSEKANAKEFFEFSTETSKSLAEKNMATDQKGKYRDEANSKLDKASDDLTLETKVLTGSIKELLELQPACIDTGMSYADRVAMREQEIQSLKKALCILGAYAKFGPDGLADAC